MKEDLIYWLYHYKITIRPFHWLGKWLFKRELNRKLRKVCVEKES